MTATASSTTNQGVAPNVQRKRTGMWESHPNIVRTVSVVVFLALWQYVGSKISPLFLAPPSSIYEAAKELILSGELGNALMETLYPFAIGTAISIVAGIVIGILMAESRLVEYRSEEHTSEIQ